MVIGLHPVNAHAQEKQNKVSPEESVDIIRTRTDLVQTDVMVFDKRGRFVEGLHREDFELRIDGEPKPISFFDRVVAGSYAEETQLAAARGGSSTVKQASAPVPAPLDRGRTVFFFVDDLHMSANNLTSAREVLLHYIEKEMGQNDEAAITSPSGQIGFLQQLTDNRNVLRAATGRLKPRPYLVRDFDRPPMTEYQALAIQRNNRDVIDYFVDEIIKEMPNMPAAAAAQLGNLPRSRAEQQVRDRAQLILQQAAPVTTNTLSALDSLVRFAGKLPGRKLIFLISEGFFLDLHNSDSFERLRHITSAAARNGVVIYSMDVRGLVTGVPDASSDAAVDTSGRLQRISGSERIESQDALNALAKDTGGGTIFNTNALDSGVNKALQETSAYYLLAWRPDTEEQKTDKFRRLEVSIVGRPGLAVRMRSGFFEMGRGATAKPTRTDEQNAAGSSAEKKSESQLKAALAAPFPDRGIPVSLNLTYVNNPDKGLVLTVALQVRADALSFNTEKDQQTATVKIAGLVYSAEGKLGANFEGTINAHPIGPNGKNSQDLIYTYPLTVPPGLYQVRVGVSDEKGGKVGSAQDWIEIPDVAAGRLALSSIIVSERKPGLVDRAASATGRDSQPLDSASFNVDHRFQINSFLRFVVFLYSAPRAGVKPDMAIQVQILRNNQPVLTTASRKVSTDGVPDLSRLAYAAEISLEHLPPGLYMLQVTAIDRLAGNTASQRTRFEIQ